MPCARADRFAGTTKLTYGKLVRLALDGLFAFSYRPLQLASAFGATVSVAAFLIALAVVFLKLVHGFPVHGWTSLIVAVLFLGGVQLICLGILGEYVARIYDEVRARPPFVVAAVVVIPACPFRGRARRPSIARHRVSRAEPAEIAVCSAYICVRRIRRI